jgi:hypothetical protein
LANYTRCNSIVEAFSCKELFWRETVPKFEAAGADTKKWIEISQLPYHGTSLLTWHQLQTACPTPLLTSRQEKVILRNLMENCLARIGQHGMADDDSSEVVLDYTIDFSMVNDDEGIRQRLLDLNPGLSPGDLDADYLIENYLEGINTIKGDGSVTVARANISGLYFRGLVFWDLSGNWCLGVSASMEDAGSIDGCNCQGHNDSTWERELQSVWYSRHSNCFCRRRQWPDRRVNRSSSWRRIY